MEREQGRPACPALARQNSCSRETGESISPWHRRQEVRLRVGRLTSWARGGEKTGLVKLEKEAANSTFPAYYIAIKFSEQTFLLSLEKDIRAYCSEPVVSWCGKVLMLYRITNEFLMRQSIREQVLWRPRPYPASPAWKGPHVVRCQKWGGLFLSTMFVLCSKKSRASPLERCESDHQALT